MPPASLVTGFDAKSVRRAARLHDLGNTITMDLDSVSPPGPEEWTVPAVFGSPPKEVIPPTVGILVYMMHVHMIYKLRVYMR